MTDMSKAVEARLAEYVLEICPVGSPTAPDSKVQAFYLRMGELRTLKALANEALSTIPEQQGTESEAEGLVAELRDPWANNPDDSERGPIPDWCAGLLHRAATALTNKEPSDG